MSNQDDKPDLGAEDAAAFAAEFQKAANEGGFNPFSLLTGERRFHSLFLAPFSKQMAEGRDRYLQHGDGPLLSLVEQFKHQGLEEAAAREQVGLLLGAAQGMCVILVQDDQGFIATPQLFFGHLEDAYLKQVVELCGPEFPDPDGVRACLLGIRSLAERGATFPDLFVCPGGSEEAAEYWQGVGEGLLTSVDEGLFGAHPERVADLAFWASSAMAAAEDLDGDTLFALGRLAIIGGDIDAACAFADRLLSDYEPEDEDLAVFLDQLAKAAVRHEGAERALRFFRERDGDLDGILGGCYELELPRFIIHAAAVVSQDDLLAAAQRLQRADRKSFRHDLNREPLWRVGVEPAELLDTNEAAELIDRSVQFVAKRLEQGTIPFHVDGEQVRIPKAALRNWQAVMDQFELLD